MSATCFITAMGTEAFMDHRSVSSAQSWSALISEESLKEKNAVGKLWVSIYSALQPKPCLTVTTWTTDSN